MKNKIKSAVFYFRITIHETTHVFFGILVFFFAKSFFLDLPWFAVFLAGLAGVLPDLDHLLFFFIYGRKKDYTLLVRSILKNDGWRALTNFLRVGHKNQTGLISHNLLSVVILIFLIYYFYEKNLSLPLVFVGGLLSHFVVDIFDDLIVLGALNPNWYFKFGKENRRKKRNPLLKLEARLK